MNYRHAFHAGNFADVFKHVLLARILVYLTRKDAPLRFIDTHAGVGRYDLTASEAQRSGEWRYGVARLKDAKPPPAIAALLAPYLKAVGPLDAQGPPAKPIPVRRRSRRRCCAHRIGSLCANCIRKIAPRWSCKWAATRGCRSSRSTAMSRSTPGCRPRSAAASC